MLAAGVVVAVVVVALAGQGDAYPGGAPTLGLQEMMSGMCTTGNLRPGHKQPTGEHIFPQRGAAPFTLSATLVGPGRVYQQGSKVKVTLTAHRGHSFKGFFIYGDGEDARAGVKGSFDPETPTQAVKKTTFCRDGITHTDGRINKTSVSIVWTAPSNFSHGAVQFAATVVERFDTFYTGVVSQVVPADKTIIKQSVYDQNRMRQMFAGGPGGMFGGMNLQSMMQNIRTRFGQKPGAPPMPPMSPMSPMGGGFNRG